MSTTQSTVALFLASDVYYRFQDPTTSVFGPRQLIETEKLEINTPSELKEKTSKGRETYGQTFVSVRVPKPTEVIFTFSQANRDIFAAKLAGEIQEINDAVTAIPERTVTAVLDEWVEIGVSNINPTGFTVKSADGTDTFVKDTDYQLNERLGLIKALSGGDITAGPIKVSGNTVAVTGTRIIGGRKYKRTISFELDGVNQVDGKNVVLKAGQATVSPEDAHDFLSGELDSITLKGRLEIPAGSDRPFTLDLYK